MQHTFHMETLSLLIPVFMMPRPSPVIQCVYFCCVLDDIWDAMSTPLFAFLHVYISSVCFFFAVNAETGDGDTFQGGGQGQAGGLLVVDGAEH